MKTILVAALSLAAASGVAFAQDVPAEPVAFYVPLDASPEAAPEPAPLLPGPQIQLGIRTGYLRAPEADRGTWFGGVQVRAFLGQYLAVEGSIEFHQSDFEEGDVLVTQNPVQVTGLLFPFPDWPLRPYALAGAGWYYTRVDFSGPFSILDDEVEHTFGLHGGGGAEWRVGERTSLSADVRYIWLDDLDLDAGTVDDEFNYWQLTAALNLGF